MHIVYVSREYPPSLRGGGIATYVKEMATAMVAAGHQVTVVCASDDTRLFSDEIVDGVRVIRLSGGDFVVRGIEPVNIWTRLRELYRFRSYRHKVVNTIRQLQDVDIIEVPEFGAESLFFEELNIPFVVRLHTPSLFNRNTQKISSFRWNTCFRYLQQLKEFDLMRRAKNLSSCSFALADWTKNNIKVKSAIDVIYNPVRVSNVTKKESRESIPYILFAGTISDVKGVEDLIEACIILHEQGDIHDLIICGKEGEYAGVLRNKYVKYPWIQFKGKLPHDILYDMYNEADAVVFPSWWDNMPMVCIEAMMNEALVIGSSEGGMSEIITNGLNGFIVPPKFPKTLAQKISKVLKLSIDEKQRIRKNARMRIVDDFSAEVIASRMIEYYKHVINDYTK